LKKKRLDNLIVDRKIINSRSKAQAMIMAGQVFVNKKKITKSGMSFENDVLIKISNLHPEWVSRGAMKLLEVFNKIEIDVNNKICLDIGSSTGGFSQVLLKNKAKKIFAVDVGKNQLHESLRKEKKIISIESCNARYLTKNIISDLVDILVCDVSFISLKKVILPNLKFLKNNSFIIALIKPQFEVNKKYLKKGIVKDDDVHIQICNEIKNWFILVCKLNVLKILESPIKGPKGNKEFFIVAKYYK
tara:strand:+ start:32019 stop:32756 length:738 start_codon:yes stop_codon:yes gene_type:complete